MSKLESKDIEETSKKIIKAYTDDVSSTTLIELIAPLKEWTATEKMLRQTNIGRTMGKLRQHKDRDVATLATELVSKWKSDVKKVGSSPASATKTIPQVTTVTATSTSMNGNGSADTQMPDESSLPTSGDSGAVAIDTTSWKGDSEKRNAATDKINYQVTNNAIRDSCIKLMYDGLAYMSSERPDDILKVAVSVEQAAFDVYQPETSQPYKTRMRSLFQNLKIKTNSWLRNRVYNGIIEPSKFVRMTHEELKSDDLKDEEARLKIENMNNAMVAQEQKSVSASLQCGKCGQKQVIYSQAQTRSADEPMTTFCECKNCGKRWKFS